MHCQKFIHTLGVLLVFSGVCALKSIAQEPQKEQAAVQSPDKAAMSKEMMAKMQAFSTPNENHKVLDQFVGSWDNTVKFWMAPGGEPQVSQGHSETKWILNGHFIEQIFHGTHMDQPFEGKWLIGYDNLKKEYVSVWLDGMSTGLNTSSGSYDPASKNFTEKGSFSCPIKNGPMSYRSQTKIIDENTYAYEMYMPDESGKEFKAMEITYTRKK